MHTLVVCEDRGHPAALTRDGLAGLADDGFHFLETASEHGRQPAGWTQTEGDGRICVLTPGHYLEVWLRPAYQVLLRNGLDWCRAGAQQGRAS